MRSESQELSSLHLMLCRGSFALLGGLIWSSKSKTRDRKITPVISISRSDREIMNQLYIFAASFQDLVLEGSSERMIRAIKSIPLF